MSVSNFFAANHTVDLWKIPVIAPPPGVQSDFINPHSLAKSLIIVHTVFLAVTLIAVAARFYGKEAYQGRRYDWSDATCILAFLGSIAHSGLTIYNTTIYYGRHSWDIPALSMTRSHVMRYATVDIVYVIAIYCIKISLLLSFHRLFWMHQRAIHAVYVGFVLVSVLSIPHLSVSIVRVRQCSGLAALTIEICKNRAVDTTNIIFGCFGLATDCYILAIPICLLRTMNIRLGKKIGLMAVFLAGGVACVMSICRVVVVRQEFRRTDTLYTAARVSHFSAVEVKIAIVCGCAPYFPAFLRHSRSSLASAYANLSFGRMNSASEVDSKEKGSSSSVVERTEPRAQDSLDFSMLSPELRQVQPVHTR